MKKLATLTILTSLLWAGAVAAKDVTVCWKPPVLNTDGSALTDLKGYRIEFGLLGIYNKAVSINSAGATCGRVTGLGAGVWWFRVVAISASAESDPSSSAMQIVLSPATQGSIEDAGTNRTIPPKK